MKNILLLTKIFLKNSMFKKINSNTNGKKPNKYLQTIGIIVLFAYIIGVFGYLSYQIIDMLQQVNQESLVLGVFLLAIAFLVFIQSVTSCMNLFYFSKDIENVLPLPIKPHQILIAKFNVLIITEYITILLFALAPFLIYGILTGASLLFYLYGTLILLIFPILPALISSLLVILLMSFSKFVKNKERLQVVRNIAYYCTSYGNSILFYKSRRYDY